MFARLYNVAWCKTGRDRPVLPMATIKTQLDAAGAATSAARTDFRYIKRGVLQLPGVASDQDYRANYLIYSNDDAHYFGAWIDSIDWASAGSFAVSFTDDNFTTFAAGATVEGFLTRKTIADWSLAHAPTTNGDFNICGWTKINTWNMQFTADRPPLLFYLLPAHSITNRYAFSRIPSATFIAIVQDNADLIQMLDIFSSASFNFNSLVACYAIPAGLILSEMITRETYQWSTASGASATLKTFTNTGSPLILTNGITEDTVRLKPADTYTALINDHDMQIRVLLGGSTHMIRPKDINSNFDFTVEVGFSPTPFVTISPHWNGNSSSPSFGYFSFPQVSVSSEAFSAWLRQSAIPSTVGIIGGAFKGASGFGEALGKGIKSVIGDAIVGYSSTDYSQGNSDAVSAAGQRFLGIDIMIPANWAEAVSYYAQFGFPTQGRLSFSLTPPTSRAYEFIQSIDNIITGEMPLAAKNEIDAALNAGVRCWNTVQIGGYIT